MAVIIDVIGSLKGTYVLYIEKVEIWTGVTDAYSQTDRLTD